MSNKDSKKIGFDSWGIATTLTAAHIHARTGKKALSVGESLDMLEEIHQQLLGMLEIEPNNPPTPNSPPTTKRH